MKNYLLFLLLTLVLTSGSCKKSKDEISIAFSCKLNGDTWNPYSGDLKLREAEAHLTNDGTELFIKGLNTKSHEDIGFGIYTPGTKISVGKYKLNMPTMQFGYYSKNDFKGEFKTKTGFVGEVEIVSFDKSRKTITGRFFFNGFNETTNTSIAITAGEFNLRYVEF